MKAIVIHSKTYGRKEVLVDDEDYELVSQYKWNLDKIPNSNKFYAIHSFNKGKDENGTYRFSSFKMHRLIMRFPKTKIDHKDNDGLNNLRSNLRLATNNQNGYNQTINANSKSGFKGVSYKNTEGRYAVRIRVNGRIIYGGGFQNIVAAAKKYNELAVIHHGEFAKLNIITPELEAQYKDVPLRLKCGRKRLNKAI